MAYGGGGLSPTCSGLPPAAIQVQKTVMPNTNAKSLKMAVKMTALTGEVFVKNW